jgi:FkbM family methyltransferase
VKDHLGIYLPDYDTHFERMLDKSLKKDNCVRYQWRVRDHAISLLGQRRNALDIGANVGLWTMDLVNDFDQVHAFEPVGDFRDCLVKNTKKSNYTMYPVALGDLETEIDMIITPENTGHSHVNTDTFGKGTIPMHMLDSYDFNEIDLIKVDCEGYEVPILNGAKETILRNRPILIVEQQNHEYQQDRKELPAVQLLESWGMKRVCNFNKDWILSW